MGWGVAICGENFIRSLLVKKTPTIACPGCKPVILIDTRALRKTGAKCRGTLSRLQTGYIYRHKDMLRGTRQKHCSFYGF